MADPRTDSNRIIQGLWIGPELSVMEQLSIASFLKHGHEYHLFAYDEVRNVPAGALIKDGNEILPASAIFQYRERPSYSGFSNFFRYKILLERGGWWADSDMVCLRPFDFADEYVFSSELNLESEREVTNVGVIKAPRGSEAIAYAWQVCQTKQPDKLVWGEIGPALMATTVDKFHLDRFQKPHYVFCPITDWRQLLEPYVVGVHESAYAIHLWNSTWDFMKQDKNARYHPDCIYEQLKKIYL
jgi:mannosyltransferase OCH1-like enzyme